MQELRPFWARLFNFNWKFSLALALLICVPRFILVLNANSSGYYNSIGLIMVVSALMPFIFLSKLGRRQIGIRSTRKFQWLFAALLAGIAFALALHFLGSFLYGDTVSNWYNYIARSYKIPADISQQDKLIMFSIFAVTGMSFSPVGEEFFFRGIVHGGFANSAGENKASVIDSFFFALTHISHFGLVFISGSWSFLFIPALIWAIAMYFVSRIFFLFKRKSDSIWGAVICHAGFNLGMIWAIFYLS